MCYHTTQKEHAVPVAEAWSLNGLNIRSSVAAKGFDAVGCCRWCLFELFFKKIPQKEATSIHWWLVPFGSTKIVKLDRISPQKNVKIVKLFKTTSLGVDIKLDNDQKSLPARSPLQSAPLIPTEVKNLTYFFPGATKLAAEREKKKKDRIKTKPYHWGGGSRPPKKQTSIKQLTCLHLFTQRVFLSCTPHPPHPEKKRKNNKETSLVISALTTLT